MCEGGKEELKEKIGGIRKGKGGVRIEEVVEELKMVRGGWIK